MLSTCKAQWGYTDDEALAQEVLQMQKSDPANPPQRRLSQLASHAGIPTETPTARHAPSMSEASVQLCSARYILNVGETTRGRGRSRGGSQVSPL